MEDNTEESLRNESEMRKLMIQVGDVRLGWEMGERIPLSTPPVSAPDLLT